jgi:nucleotide-binding universal stress UspA family protein
MAGNSPAAIFPLGLSVVIPLRRLLCPVDFSEDSRRALEYAAALAERRGLELTVLHVEANQDARLETDVLQRVEGEIRAFVTATTNASGAIHVSSVFGSPVQGILDQAVALGSDLIVMGTRGRSGLARVLLGSVTERVVREARCPVITIPLALSGDVSAEVQPWSPILCATDFSPSCKKALDFALWAAQQEDARLILLNAVASPANVLVAEPLPILMDALPARTELEQEAYTRLVAPMPDDDSVRRRIGVVVAIGDPSNAILRVAADNNVQLIVMGVKSRSTTNMAVFGSTTRRVIQAARCPVLSICAEQHEEGWPIPKGSS